jgi:hypothetical protein
MQRRPVKPIAEHVERMYRRLLNVSQMIGDWLAFFSYARRTRAARTASVITELAASAIVTFDRPLNVQTIGNHRDITLLLLVVVVVLVVGVGFRLLVLVGLWFFFRHSEFERGVGVEQMNRDSFVPAVDIAAHDAK